MTKDEVMAAAHRAVATLLPGRMVTALAELGRGHINETFLVDLRGRGAPPGGAAAAQPRGLSPSRR